MAVGYIAGFVGAGQDLEKMRFWKTSSHILAASIQQSENCTAGLSLELHQDKIHVE